MFAQFRYPGVTGVLSASVTVGLGITPSVTTVSIPPTPGLQKRGTVSWLYNGSLVRSFPDSAITSWDVSRAGGFTVWQVQIADRRWAWITGEITGEYNVRKNGEVVEDRQKTPRELATLCLEAMGEQGFNVDALPEDDRPYVNWEIEVPAKALSEICDLYGCAVSLQIDNTVKIVKIGEGAEFPAGFLSNEVAIDPADFPRSLKLVTSPTRWQVDLKLVPVGYENDGSELKDGFTGLDGTIKPINELSYRPTGGGWEGFGDDSEFGEDDEPLTKNHRQLAKEGVWRLYRVEIEGIELEGNLVELEEREQILPIIGELLETIGEGANKRPREAIVWGNYYEGESLGANTDTDEITREDYRPILNYEGSFDIDEENGLVKFSEQVFAYDDEFNVIPPKLWLRCTINLRDKDTRGAQRQFKEVIIDPNSPSKPLHIVREDIVPEWKKNTGDEWESNEEEIEEEADFYLRQELANYQGLIGASAEYAGFVALNTDGAIRQVQYQIDNAGYGKSNVSRNNESTKLGITLEEQKQRRKWSEAAEKAKREKRKERSTKRRERGR